MVTTLKVAGLDPSLSNFGIATATLDIIALDLRVDTLHVEKTAPEKDKKLRKVVRKNSEDLERVCALHAGATAGCAGVDLVFVEVPVGSQSARAMVSYGASLGVIAAVKAVKPMIQVTPTEVKVAGTGIKTATKEEMIEAMIARFPDAPWPMQTKKGVTVPIADKCEHLADAVAAILAGIATDEFQRMLAMYRAALRVAS